MTDDQTDAFHASFYLCPFCKKPVKADYESLQGCSACADDWMINEQGDHPVG